MATTGRLAQSIAVVAAVLVGLTLAPAANAAFSGSKNSATSITTATIPVPSAAAFPVSASCLKVTGVFHISITSTGTGTVQYADYYEMVVRNPAGVVQFTGDLSNMFQRSYTTLIAVGTGKGNWTYDIVAKRTVSGSNSWSSQPLRRTLVCT